MQLVGSFIFEMRKMVYSFGKWGESGRSCGLKGGDPEIGFW